jgi:hypothetical protein
MVTDFVLAPLIAVVKAALNALPAGSAPSLPSIAPLWTSLAGFDSLVPIGGPLAFMLGLLALGVAFVALRLVLTLWNLIYP